MKNRLIGFVPVVCIAFICVVVACGPAPTPSATLAPSATSVPPTHTPTPTASATATASATPTPPNLRIEASGVRVHPSGKLYAGDMLSFEIDVLNGNSTNLRRVPVSVDWGSGQARGVIEFLRANESGSLRLLWVWDSSGQAGAYQVRVIVDPDEQFADADRSNNVVAIPIELHADAPVSVVGAQWREVSSRCCRFHYITGTAAERDIEALLANADEAVAYVEERLDLQQSEPLDIYMLSRVLGHGGFASGIIAISYLDRNYASGGLTEVFRHESVHLIDRQITHGERPPFMVEGFATYISGGHYHLEPLPERAAALLLADRYLPLRDLIDNFYPSQHESGYVLASAFIDYLVQRGGYDQFIALYSTLERRDDESDASMLDHALQEHYGAGLEEIEQEWKDQLRTLDAESQLADMLGVIDLYDTLRRYQQQLDPSAYVWEAWLPEIRVGSGRNIVADYMRHPETPENIALETMLIAAQDALQGGELDRFDALLASVHAVLDTDGVFVDALAARYLQVVQVTLQEGYTPQQIMLSDQQAQVWATLDGSPTLVQLTASLHDNAWSVLLER